MNSSPSKPIVGNSTPSRSSPRRIPGSPPKPAPVAVKSLSKPSPGSSYKTKTNQYNPNDYAFSSSYKTVFLSEIQRPVGSVSMSLHAAATEGGSSSNGITHQGLDAETKARKKAKKDQSASFGTDQVAKSRDPPSTLKPLEKDLLKNPQKVPSSTADPIADPNGVQKAVVTRVSKRLLRVRQESTSSGNDETKKVPIIIHLPKPPLRSSVIPQPPAVLSKPSNLMLDRPKLTIASPNAIKTLLIDLTGDDSDDSDLPPLPENVETLFSDSSDDSSSEDKTRSSHRGGGVAKKKKLVHGNGNFIVQLQNPFHRRPAGIFQDEELEQDLVLLRKSGVRNSSNTSDEVTAILKDTKSPAPLRLRNLYTNSPYKQAVDSQDNCSACLGSGQLLCCDTCPRVFHFSCVPEGFGDHNAPEGTWQCRSCVYKYGKIGSSSSIKKSVQSHSGPLPTLDENMAESESGGDGTASTSLFSQLCEGMDKMNPRAFQLPAYIRDQYQHVIAHPITGDYLDTRDVLITKTNVGVGVSTRSSKRQPANVTEKPVAPLRPISNDKEKDQDDVSALPVCFQCSKTDQSGLAPAPLLTYTSLDQSTGIQRPCHGSTLIKCDYCEIHWHLDCLDPPLATIPLALRPDEHTPIDLLDHATLKRKIWFTGQPHPLDQPIYFIPDICKVSEGEQYTCANVQLLNQAAPESSIFESERFIKIRPKWMCPLHADIRASRSVRVKWDHISEGWDFGSTTVPYPLATKFDYSDFDEYEVVVDGKEKKPKRLRLVYREEDPVAKSIELEQKRQSEWLKLQKLGLVHVDLRESTVPFEPPSAVVSESKLILQFRDHVTFKKNESQSTLNNKNSVKASSMKTIDAQVLENANLYMRPDLYSKFEEFGNEWDSTRVDDLCEGTVGSDQDKFGPLVNQLVDQEAPFVSTHLQETAAALLLFQLDLQDRFIERHLIQENSTE